MDAAMEPFEVPSETSLKVMLFYGDRLTRTRVMLIYQRLHEQLWQDFDFDTTWWRFDYLADPDVAKVALDAAHDADVIFFAIKAGTELPDTIKSWLMTLRHGGTAKGEALLTLLEIADEPVPPSSSVRSFLRDVAHRAGLDFLPYYRFDRGPSPTLLPRLDNAAIADSRAPQTGGRARSAPVQRWGLNE